MRNFRFLFTVIFIAACATVQADTMDLSGIGGRYAVKVTSLKEARFKATTRQQYDFSCGSAALATLLTYHYGYPVTEQSVFEEMFVRGDQEKIRREGFSLLDIKTYLNAHQFQADGFAFPLTKLLETGLPAIVLIAENGYHHFVVIKGMIDGRILIGDPSNGTRAVSRESFESTWVNKLLFVIHNKQELAKFNDAADWQVAPRAPLTAGINHEGLGGLTLGKFGPGDF
ncbi:MAG: C39 family peptidase [Rhodoferax sp.]|uniref:C39 family peptidase n=1 Tax=Rhodoferax sp. TaxID=50421 RepID=UPI0017DFFBAB|nr:C39 family peptidase [Rhodoferax sp.]NMM13152.1 C39 family peptidase [Rhodoferax sp.]